MDEDKYNRYGKQKHGGGHAGTRLVMFGLAVLLLSFYIVGEIRFHYENNEMTGVVVKLRKSFRPRPAESDLSHATIIDLEDAQQQDEELGSPFVAEEEQQQQEEEQQHEEQEQQQQQQDFSQQNDSNDSDDNMGAAFGGFGTDDPKAGDSSAYHFGKPFVSKQGRKFIAATVTLPQLKKTEDPNWKEVPYNQSRLGVFEKTWAEQWPGLHIKRQQSFVQHRSLQGFAVLTAFYSAILEAHLTQGDRYDYLMLFEDDGLPFPNTKWPGLYGEDNDLERRLKLLENKNGCGLILGGHFFRYDPSFLKSEATKKESITHAQKGFGCYGFVLTRQCIPHIVEEWTKVVERTMNFRSPPDVIIWKTFNLYEKRRKNSGGYVSVPLLIDHHSGFSNTWTGFVKRTDFEGIPEFWNHKHKQFYES